MVLGCGHWEALWGLARLVLISGLLLCELAQSLLGFRELPLPMRRLLQSLLPFLGWLWGSPWLISNTSSTFRRPPLSNLHYPA